MSDGADLAILTAVSRMTLKPEGEYNSFTIHYLEHSKEDCRAELCGNCCGRE